ncbi:hypothetical protein [Sphingobium yanoikuyae]|jgi:hypothetical protein|uniref:hypothetical protein n=1 Tax=Sphingobium TaxID=165695 RepID=UPI0028AFD402|nr:hypothetical protein [Sphingobium yanoikuyae]
MMVGLGEWVVSAVGSVAITGIVISATVVLMRDTLARYLTKSVEHHFEERLEKFKGDIRANERELEQIRGFLTTAQRERDAAIQTKRLEAAESLLRERQVLSRLSMLVEYMKILNTDKMLDDPGDPKIAEFIKTLLQPLQVDKILEEIKSFDRTLSRLYLSEAAVKTFEAYQTILMSAVTLLKVLSMPLDKKSDLIKRGKLSQTVIELVPGTADGFEKFGEGYAYHWATYLHDEVLRLLRNDILGMDASGKDAASAERLVLESRLAQAKVQMSLRENGLSQGLIRTE